MTQKEIDRQAIIDLYLKHKLTGEQAGSKIGVSSRQIRNIASNYKKNGSKALAHGNRGRNSNNKLSSDKINKIITIISSETNFYDFKPTMLNEILNQKFNINISTEKLRQIMISINMWTAKSNKSKVFQRIKRSRKDCFGDMTQFDGSYHKWLEDRNGGEEHCLLLGIDDATNMVTYAKFANNEGCDAVFNFWKESINKNGKPISIYLDKFATYKSNHKKATFEPEVKTQFERACNQLGIKLIFANSPQAKGRVEKYNHTFQDRLVKELRLADINNVDDANKYLHEVFIPKFNDKYGLNPKSSVDMHNKLSELEKDNLYRIFCRHSLRKIANDYTISYNSQYYQLYNGTPLIYPKMTVTVEEVLEGENIISIRGNPIKNKKILEKPPKYNNEELNNIKLEKQKQADERAKQRFVISKQRQNKYKVEQLLLKYKSLK